MQRAQTPPTSRSRIARVIRSIGTGRLFLLSIVTTIIGLAILIGLFWLLVTITGASDATPWPLLEGFMATITTALFLGGGLFALAEYIEGEEARRQAEEVRQQTERIQQQQEAERAKQQGFALYENLFERLMSNDEIEIRGWIIRNVPKYDPADHEDWIRLTREVLFRSPNGSPNHGQMCVKHILNTFDYLGFVALNYWELDAALMDWLNPMVTKVWDRIGPYVEEESRRREEPNYYLWARAFSEKCCAWRDQKRLPPPKFVEDAL